jgi:hypothetical protein
MKLTLHRSLIFWSGLLIIAFIIAAWRDSMRNISWGGWGNYQVAQEQAALKFVLLPVPTTDFWGRGTFHLESKLVKNWLPRPYFVHNQPRTHFRDWTVFWETYYDMTDLHARNRFHFMQYPKGWLLLLPHWLLLLVFVPFWLGLLIWRARRRRRLVGMATN